MKKASLVNVSNMVVMKQMETWEKGGFNVGRTTLTVQW